MMMENYRFSIGRYWYLLMNNNPLSSDLGLHFQASYATQTFWLQTTSSQFYQLRLALLALTMTFNYLATKLDGFDISQKRDQWFSYYYINSNSALSIYFFNAFNTR